MAKMQIKEISLEMPEVIGKHVYGNLDMVDPKLISNLNALIKIVVESTKIGNLHIIEMITKKFNPYNGFDGGVSIIALIEESHIALHTWPESMYATLDIYSCGEESNPDAAFNYIVSKLKPKKIVSNFVDRGKLNNV
ncbi:S-adenosylmethionine decarboxylase [Candidatus Mancarchaeum acidiphilum]|uniref:S-adenosylmethionine decarboxylase proenzyme n=1 Tax=Candidatus Mancarchaeum acidiphilum TaxID=1920749 RepID=A0A218NN87_9ARCH|nr:adenosylmethionine decarboxylase [Candidatus Mancarchaeum acidiphilum]ASI13940.1 S-adenosylmethionine decarboxylase [Candidatus Mancarchaeum acidiphilum]